MEPTVIVIAIVGVLGIAFWWNRRNANAARDHGQSTLPAPESAPKAAVVEAPPAPISETPAYVPNPSIEDTQPYYPVGTAAEIETTAAEEEFNVSTTDSKSSASAAEAEVTKAVVVPPTPPEPPAEAVAAIPAVASEPVAEPVPVTAPEPAAKPDHVAELPADVLAEPIDIVEVIVDAPAPVAEEKTESPAPEFIAEAPAPTPEPTPAPVAVTVPVVEPEPVVEATPTPETVADADAIAEPVVEAVADTQPIIEATPEPVAEPKPAKKVRTRAVAKTKTVSKTKAPSEKAPAAKRPTAKAAKPVATLAKAVDDLTVIEGIGPKINTVLHKAEVNTFAELAALKPAAIKKILDEGGVKIGDPGTWPQQAKLAAGGKWEKLKTLQDSLKGGRKA